MLISKRLQPFILAALICGNSGTVRASLPDWNQDIGQRRLISIPDVHGDADALKTLLAAIGVYSPETDSWIGGDAYILQTGDNVSRGPKSREVLDLEIKLAAQARQVGGEFRSLVGNHELMWLQGRTSFYHANDPKDFQSFASSPQAQDGPRAALMGHSTYAEWLANQNTIEMINGTLFVHAGFGSWGKWVSAGTVNRWVHNWILYYQGAGPKPPIWTRWVIGKNGPLFSRELAPQTLQSTVAPLSEKNLNAILKKYGAKRIVIGHSRVLSVETALQHPQYGTRVISGDVGISVAYRGPLVAYVHHEDAVEAITVDRKTGKIISRDFTADHVSPSQLESAKTPLRCDQILR